MRLIDADSLDETITRLNEQDWGITRNEYKLIDRVIFEMPTVDVLEQIRDEIQENINYNKEMNYQGIVAGLLLTLDIIDNVTKAK